MDKGRPFGAHLFAGAIRDIRRNKTIYLLLLPVLAFYIIFCYVPLAGLQIAFKNYSPSGGLFGGQWVGFEHFKTFFTGFFFKRTLTNTILLSLFELLYSFPLPIMLALLMNELRAKRLKSVVQTATYLPHFLSLVVVCGLTRDFLAPNGLINMLLQQIGLPASEYMVDPGAYRTIYVSSGVWQQMGWDSILYLSALTAVDTQLYEACTIDGGGRLRQTWHITLPGITPTIITLLILRIGRLMSIGVDKTLLLYNPLTYETADIISSYVYRKGLLEANYGFASAVGMFNSVINLILLVTVNKLCKRLTDSSLW